MKKLKVLAVIWISVVATVVRGAVAEMRPMLDHIAAPRKVIDLCGTWEKAEQRLPGMFNPVVAQWNAVRVPDPLDAFNSSREYYYRRTFTLSPDDVAGKRILLDFERLMVYWSVRVNGTEFTGDADSSVHTVIDITSAVKPGENELSVRVWNDQDKRVKGDIMPHPLWGLTGKLGISAPVCLEILNPVAIESVRVQTKVSPEKVLTLKTTVTNASDTATTVRLTAQIGEKVESDVTAIPAKGAKEILLEKKWPDAKLWNPDSPNLYDVDLKLHSVTNSQHLLDAYRQRIGFREITIKGHRILLNGFPVFLRGFSTGWGYSLLNGNPYGLDREGIRHQMLLLKKNGVSLVRVFSPALMDRLATVADEVGLLLCPTANAYHRAGEKTDVFWALYERHLHKFIRELQAHPSVAYWGASNEFGTIYSTDGKPNERETTAKQVKYARIFERDDGTRPWTAHGEICLDYPVRKGYGPAPIRSFHYPVFVLSPGRELPDVAYWYEDGKPWAWQKASAKDKPLMISEDFYHGMIETTTCMEKFAGDSIFSVDGFVKAYHYAYRAFAAGYCLGGVSEWEPVNTFPYHLKNVFYANGYQPAPDYLIAVRGFFPNLYAGETDVRDVHVHNVLFTPQNCRLVETAYLDGRKIAQREDNFLLNPGIPFTRKLTLAPPASNRQGVYTVRFELFGNGGARLAEETLDYQVYPRKKAVAVPAGTALLADKASPLRASAFDKGIHDDTARAIGSGARQIVLDKMISAKEGRALDGFVRSGGRVLALDIRPESGVPVTVERRQPMTFVWKRNKDALKGVKEESLRSWKPDGRLGESYIAKSGDEDSFVLCDSAHGEAGLVGANVQWTARGKGAWLFALLPVMKCFDAEPAAPYVAEALIAEMDRPTPDVFSRKVLQLEAGSPFAELFRRNDFQFTQGDAEIPGSVLWLDGSRGITPGMIARITTHCNAGGTVFVAELPLETDPEFLKACGIAFRTAFIPAPGHEKIKTAGDWPQWAFSDSMGLLAGLSTDDFYRGNGKLYTYFRYKMIDVEPPRNKERNELAIVNADITPLPGGRARVHARPGAFAEMTCRKGKLVLSTMRLRSFQDKYARKNRYLLRTLLANLGAATAFAQTSRDYRQIDLKGRANRNFWSNPKYRRADGSFRPIGWFDHGKNDLRFFPVNQCGWSLEANNHCPVEAFPKNPVNYGGCPFDLIDPETNGGKAILVLSPGERITVPVNGGTIGKLWFLGADSGKTTHVTVQFNERPDRVDMKHAVHFGTYRRLDKVMQGKVAWTGPSLVDNGICLYVWSVRNPDPDRPLESVTFENVAQKDSLAIIAVTAENGKEK